MGTMVDVALCVSLFRLLSVFLLVFLLFPSFLFFPRSFSGGFRDGRKVTRFFLFVTVL